VFRAGRNIAIKVPLDQWQRTVRFYDHALELRRLDSLAPAVVFALGADRLWIDRIATLAKAEVWLEFQTDSAAVAADYLRRADVVTCDDSLEALPAAFLGLWISSPANIVELLSPAGPL